MTNSSAVSQGKFASDCVRCPRLVDFLTLSRKKFPNYYGLPVPAFGKLGASLLVVGLAPGMHGANATGRPFTGDHAGVLLYSTLFKYGFSNNAKSTSLRDGLKLMDCRITNAVRCVPPQNKPKPDEVKNCRDYLEFDLDNVKDGGVIVTLGRLAHESVLKAFGLPLRDFKFGHGNLFAIKSKNLKLLSSYHCSRYNTQTKRLTTKMFESIFEKARKLIDDKRE